jgi:Rad3-related DNA helicase
MLLGRERLYGSQAKLFDEAIEIEEHKISLFEAPTGFGKSVLINTIAEAIALNENAKIIIATPTNQLAIEQLNIFKNDSRFSFDRSLNVDVVVGTSNYFDVENFTDEVYKYLDKEEVINHIQSITTNEDYLIDTLFDNVTIEEPNKKIVQELISCKTKKEFMKEFDELDISITNFAYLLTNIFYVKDFDISQYVVVCDEVHQLMDVAEQMLTNSFSLFRYRNINNQLLEKITSDKLSKKIKKQIDTVDILLKKYSNAMRAGDFYTSPVGSEGNIVSDIKETISKKSIEIEKMLTKEAKTNSSPALANTIKLYRSEKEEMLCSINSPQDVTIYLSPSRGYPTINSSRGDVRGWMLTYFWDKVYSFIGLSATILTSNDEQKGSKSAFARLGVVRGNIQQYENFVKSVDSFAKSYNRMPSAEDTEYIKLYEFIEMQKRGYVEGWLSDEKEKIITDILGIAFFAGLKRGERIERKSQRVEHIKYGVVSFKPIFKKEQAKVYLPCEDLISPQLQNSEEESVWFDAIADIVTKKHEGKNSMILCGSFYEAEEISKRLSLLSKDTNIITAQRNSSTSQMVAQFKKEGGILVGTRNYGTGINLPREELEKLFIVKLPYPIFTTKKWLDIKEKDRKFNTSFYYSSYISEMILNFRQWIGRLIRTKEDRGELYMLDSRIYKNTVKNSLFYWLDKMGTIQEEKLCYNYEKATDDSSKQSNDVLRETISNMNVDEDIKEYLLENLESIASKKELPIPLQDVKDRDFRKRYRVVRQQVLSEEGGMLKSYLN